MDVDEKHTNTPNQEQKYNNTGGQICAFWLKGNCRNGSNCKFLHGKQGKYPECPYGMNCTRQNNGCPYKHTKIQQKECHAYNLGYCPNGKNCKDLHVEKDLCINYLLGFCPDGPNCKLFHLRTMITPGQDNLDYLARSIPS